jgi:hypothetical protein
VVMPVEGCDHIGCPPDQVRLTCALVQDLDEVVNGIKQLGEHGEEACHGAGYPLHAAHRSHTEADEEKATLEGMIESHDELIMEIADEIRLSHMVEDTEDEEDDDGDGGDATTPPAAMPPPISAPPTATHEEMVIKEEDPVDMVPE